MLEEFAMEKKSSRSVQAPGKGNSTDLKKNQDNIKPFPKSSRKRESGFSSNGNKNEASRKPASQKSKSFVKIPKPRGQYYGCGKEDTKVAEYDEEGYGSVVVPGSKKHNLNHLLNFHFEPRENASRTWRPSAVYSTGKLMATHKHKYNKEQFLQANCQFVVKANGDYTSQIADPDVLVNWDLIEQIRLQSAEMVSCPICLYPPVAAKMTRCGHVYCWSCILHYLSLSDKTWHKCPICYEAVHKQDLKSVVAVPHKQYSVGDEITLRLMKRERGCLLPIPVEQYRDRVNNRPLSVSEKEIDTTYSKLLLASPEEVVSIIERERVELEIQLADENGQPETCFIEQAIEMLNQREVPEQTLEPEETLFQLEERDSDVQLDVGSPPLENIPDVGGRVRCESLSSEVESEDGNYITVDDLETPAMQHSGNSQPVKHFYFYQASEGQQIYLHAINVRMLEHCFNSLQNCPPTITGRIIEKECGSMTEELRKRLRYLQHLPITSTFEVVELQLKVPEIPRETLDLFHGQLEMRKRRRRRRAQDERKREKRISEEENKMMGRFPAPQIHLESYYQFPQCGNELSTIRPVSPPLIPSPSESSVASSPMSSHDGFSQAMDNLNLESENAGPSFAQMLRNGKSNVATAWPRASKSAKKPVASNRQALDSEQELEGYIPVRTCRQTFSDVIASALEKAEMLKNSEPGDITGTSGKKKKKTKQRVLFATGMACNTK